MNIDKINGTVMVSISGGRTSGYMAIWAEKNKRAICEFLGLDSVNILYVFANTGLEHPETLRFLNDIDTQFLDNKIVWLEGETKSGKVSTRHKIVDYNTCETIETYKTPAHPFHQHVKKYGIPNVSFKNCSRELKRNTINSYMKSIGLDEKKDFYTAIGIREDESRRVAKNPLARNIIYPLIDIIPTDKQDVLDWWKTQAFDLNIPEWLGNCVNCYKKSTKKLALSHRDLPEGWEPFIFYEKNYSTIGPEFHKYKDAKPRTNFRGKKSCADMIATFPLIINGAENYINENEDGCSESCEIYETE